jgi:hypothetical protein
MTDPSNEPITFWLKQVPNDQPNSGGVWSQRLIPGHHTVDRSRDLPDDAVVEGEGPRVGPCVKATVTCEIVSPDGQSFIGTNYCNNAQASCPRLPGEGYEKCKTICQQEGHAEVVAVALAGENAKGATAYLSGHTYACQPCQEALFGAGVRFLAVASSGAE